MTDHLTAAELETLRNWVAETLRDHMFGDGMEDAYIREGFPVFKGVDSMSELELLDELGHYNADEDTTHELKALAFRKELGDLAGFRIGSRVRLRSSGRTGTITAENPEHRDLWSVKFNVGWSVGWISSAELELLD